MCRVPCDKPPNETNNSGQTDLPGGPEKTLFGIFDYSHKGRNTDVCMGKSPEVIEGGAVEQNEVFFATSRRSVVRFVLIT